MKYTVAENNQIKHNGDVFPAGSTVELSEREAKSLLQDGVIVESDEQEVEEQTETTESVPVEVEEEKTLETMSREELDAVAEEEGLDPSDYKNKDEVRTAIRDAQEEGQEDA